MRHAVWPCAKRIAATWAIGHLPRWEDAMPVVGDYLNEFMSRHPETVGTRTPLSYFGASDCA